jgi:transcriptional regulator with XRE-family HTH domain
MGNNFNRVKEYRIKKRLSVKQFAIELGFTDAYIRQIESGDRGMSLETAIHISKVLEKSLNTIFMP